MKIEIPFNYNTLLAFIKLLKYENKRYIKLETLRKFHEVLLDEVYDDYIYNDTSYISEVDKWKGNIEFIINKNDNINNFIETYSDYFYGENDTVYLYNNITYEDLEKELFKLQREENISNRFYSVLNDSDNLYNILNIKSIKNSLLEYLKIERKLENSYLELDYNPESKKTIRKLLVLRALFLLNINQKKHYEIDAYKNQMEHIDDADYDYINDPIDMKLWANSKYFLDQINTSEDINDVLYDMYQYAIFGKTTLSIEKLDNLLNSNTSIENNEEMYNEEIYDEMDYPEYDSEDYIDLCESNDSDLIFYLTFIDKINKYMRVYGKNNELINIKNRLLYALDTDDLCLFEESNLIEKIENIKTNYIEIEDYDYLKNEIRFILEESFTKKDSLETRIKLLLVSAYYSLTQDKEIENILNNYSLNSNYDLYKNLIYNESKGYIKTLINNKNNEYK